MSKNCAPSSDLLPAEVPGLIQHAIKLVMENHLTVECASVEKDGSRNSCWWIGVRLHLFDFGFKFRPRSPAFQEVFFNNLVALRDEEACLPAKSQLKCSLR